MSSAEAVALHAVIEDDRETARTILRDFSNFELAEFADHLNDLDTLINEVREERS
jgi:hypothetical protein